MFGNGVLPGVTPGRTYRNEGTIWRGYTESTWFKTVPVGGDTEEPIKLPRGTVLIENLTDGVYSPLKASGIITDVSNLPGARLVIVADFTATSGYLPAGASAAVVAENTVLVGTMGEVDQARLLVGGAPFGELTEEQQRYLRAQLEAWNFQPVHLMQA